MTVTRFKGLVVAGFVGCLLACGGGGGATDPPVNPPLDTYVLLRLEATTATGEFVDPSNIFLGEVVTFRVTGINSAGMRVAVPGIIWQQSGNSGGVLNTSSGVFTAGSVNSTTSGLITATSQFSTVPITVPSRVVTPLAVLRGRVRLVTGPSTSRIQIKCLSGAGAVLATGYSAGDGSIRISVPANAIRFTTDFSLVDPSAIFYVRQFAYNGIDYSSAVSSCTAPLPTLLINNSTQLLSDVVLYSAQDNQNPPPPPNGCS